MHVADQPDDVLAAKNQCPFLLVPERQCIIAEKADLDSAQHFMQMNPTNACMPLPVQRQCSSCTQRRNLRRAAQAVTALDAHTHTQTVALFILQCRTFTQTVCLSVQNYRSSDCCMYEVARLHACCCQSVAARLAAVAHTCKQHVCLCETLV